MSERITHVVRVPSAPNRAFAWVLTCKCSKCGADAFVTTGDEKTSASCDACKLVEPLGVSTVTIARELARR